MSFRHAAYEWERKLIESLLNANIAPDEILGNGMPAPDTAAIEATLRRMDTDAVAAETELHARIREAGLNPDELLKNQPPDPSPTMAPVPENPEDVLRQIDLQVEESEAAFRSEIHNHGLDPAEILKSAPPPEPVGVPNPVRPPEEILQSMEDEAAASEAALLEEIRKAGLDPQEILNRPAPDLPPGWP